MRKLVVTLLMSLDGVVSAPERLLPMWDEEAKRDAVEELKDFDAFLFGRVTFQSFAARWPNVRDDDCAEALNRLPKFVASRTLRDATWQGTAVLHGEVASEIAQLKQQPGKYIMKYRIGRLDETLLAHDLIDEIRISLVPVVIGEGRHLFEDGDASLHPRLELSETKRFRNGIVRLTYAVTRNR